jgi:hypothetical protein
MRFLLLISAFATLTPERPAAAATGNTCWFGAPLSSYSFPICNEEFKFEPVLDKNLTVSTYPTVGNGMVQFGVDEDLDFMVDVIFQPSVGRSLFSTPVDRDGVFEYDLAIIGSGQVFNTARLSSTSTSSSTLVTKEIRSDTPTLTLVSMGATPDEKAFSNRSLTFIQVKDTYRVSEGSLKGFQNSFTQADGIKPEETVPGPLPLFGAGAALGFSRRIRRRIGNKAPATGSNGNS